MVVSYRLIKTYFVHSCYKCLSSSLNKKLHFCKAVVLFQGLHKLRMMDMSWNKLHNTREELSILRKHTPNLNTLDVRHNPWQKVLFWLLTVFIILPANFDCDGVYCFHIVHPSVLWAVTKKNMLYLYPQFAWNVKAFFLVKIRKMSVWSLQNLSREWWKLRLKMACWYLTSLSVC